MWTLNTSFTGYVDFLRVWLFTGIGSHKRGVVQWDAGKIFRGIGRVGFRGDRIGWVFEGLDGCDLGQLFTGSDRFSRDWTIGFRGIGWLRSWSAFHGIGSVFEGLDRFQVLKAYRFFREFGHRKRYDQLLYILVQAGDSEVTEKDRNFIYFPCIGPV